MDGFGNGALFSINNLGSLTLQYSNKVANNLLVGQNVSNFVDITQNITITSNNNDLIPNVVINNDILQFLINNSELATSGDKLTINLNQFQDSNGKALSGTLVVTCIKDPINQSPSWKASIE